MATAVDANAILYYLSFRALHSIEASFGGILLVKNDTISENRLINPI